MIALDQDGQRGRLHPADGQQRVEPQGKRPAGVHAHQPVRLGAAGGAAVQAIVFLGGLERGEALLDGLVGHGGNPQPVHGLFALGLVVDQPEDELALPPGIGGADELFRVLVVHQLFDHAELGLGFGNHLGGDGFRQDGQFLHPPFFIFFVDFVGLAERHQVAHRPGDQIAFPFQEPFAPLPAPQHSGDVPPHAGLFRDNYDHVKSSHIIGFPIHLTTKPDKMKADQKTDAYLYKTAVLPVWKSGFLRLILWSCVGIGVGFGEILHQKAK